MWFKVDDRFHTSRKVLSIPRRVRMAAVGLWTIAGAWSAGEELDGHVPAYMVEEWGGTDELVAALIQAGLWERSDDGDLRFRKWAEYQPTREQIEDKRETERARKADWRRRKSAVSPTGQTRERRGTDVLVPSNPTRPDPTRPDPSTSDEVEEGDARGGALPSPFCAKHPQGSDKPCRACGNARMAYDVAAAAEKARPTLLPRRPKTCAVHAEYPLPCDRCAADAKAAS